MEFKLCQSHPNHSNTERERGYWKNQNNGYNLFLSHIKVQIVSLIHVKTKTPSMGERSDHDELVPL